MLFRFAIFFYLMVAIEILLSENQSELILQAIKLIERDAILSRRFCGPATLDARPIWN